MDAFLIASGDLASLLLPIAGLVALICLIVFLIRLTKLLKQIGDTLGKTHTTIDLVDQSITKLQSPLDTVVKVSGGVDRTYDAGVKAMGDMKDYVVKNKDAIKEKAGAVIEKTEAAIEKVKNVKKETPVKQPGPEDIIGE
ncbi:MAG: hypothetical protein IKF18_02705 [Erysipelotrichaceae bacterium]|jgi:uncharacterized protein YoxC|nr:hypothetical protein [Erysipelotrichaceae bacterium]MBR3151334.1 hypothetical protein [Erysipelotrichaceae bacterium]MBR3167582.1 hypothetical protein [Erysipelotrichaceae bacterium]MCR5299973.1 hypothetical protein [Erysipelotrichaceae bacterium]